MAKPQLPDDHRVARYVPWARLAKDENHEPVGILGTAFQIRNIDSYLSATWIEHFSGSSSDQLLAAIQAIKNSKLDVRPKSGFAIGNIGKIRAGAKNLGHRIRVVHAPEDDNVAHASLLEWPSEATELYEMMATEIWCDLILTRDLG